jgi:hypothetical protein
VSAKEDKGKKEKKDKKAKGKGKDNAADAVADGISVANHPQASTAIRSLKGWGGLIGFLLAGYLSLQAGVPLADLVLRALVAGIAGYMVAWCCGVAAWRAIVTAEARAQLERHSARAASDTAKTGNARR